MPRPFLQHRADLMADTPAPNSSDQEMAAALDAALDAMQHGQGIDRESLLARHPALAGVLDALGQILAPISSGNSLDSTPLARPQRIGPYIIERELGAGGFSVVYLGFDPDVKRRVAIKVLHPNRLNDSEALSRFQREAHATGRLRHPGIVQLFEYSRQGPPWFLVTEYVEGLDPRIWCRQHNASAKDVATLVARIADAVEYAHQQGVCHRDLKPGNILIDESGQPRVLDFGLARLDPGMTHSTTATADGHVLGSLPYMPPEQASGQSNTADARSDVYSLGVILYELLTGQLPFQGPAHELPARVMESVPPRPSELVPDLPRDLEAICLTALARRPRDRYAKAADLAADLRAFLEGKPVVARPLSVWGRIRRVLDRRHLETLRRGWPALLLSLGTVILIGYAIVNHWEVNFSWKDSPGWRLFAVLTTKGIQLSVMIGLALWLWPEQQGTAGSSRWRWADRTPTERQVLTLVAGYYASYLILVLLNFSLVYLKKAEAPAEGDVIPTAPPLALVAGMAFLHLGATVWGWFYVWGAAFLALAILIGFAGPYGTGILGAGWFVCLVLGSIHLHWTR